MKLNRIQFLLPFLALSLFISCNESDEPIIDPIASVIVINEGNFSAANGSFDSYDELSKEYSASVFQSTNNFPVGSTIQNAIIAGNFIMSTTNAVDKVEFMDKETFDSKATVTSGMKTPFGIAANEEYAFVTNWGTFNNDTFVYDDPSIVTIDLETFEVASTFALSMQPQHALYIKNRLYVSNIGSFGAAGTSISVYEIVEGTPQIEKTIAVQAGPDKMVLDANNNIWVICTSGALVHIDTDSDEVVNTIQDVPVLGFNEKLTIDPSGDNLFWMASSGFPDYNSAIYNISTTNPVLGEAIIEGTNFHGIGVSGNALFVGNHAAYQSVGSVLLYTDYLSTPVLIETYPAGLAPNGFLFR